jgi:hypothetical protein
MLLTCGGVGVCVSMRARACLVWCVRAAPRRASRALRDHPLRHSGGDQQQKTGPYLWLAGAAGGGFHRHRYCRSGCGGGFHRHRYCRSQAACRTRFQLPVQNAHISHAPALLPAFARCRRGRSGGAARSTGGAWLQHVAENAHRPHGRANAFKAPQYAPVPRQWKGTAGERGSAALCRKCEESGRGARQWSGSWGCRGCCDGCARSVSG